MRNRKILVVSILTFIFCVIGVVFYKAELKYLRPTPIPEGYQAVMLDTEISLEELISSTGEGPAFYHFYNPDCPCSRFNLDHFQALVKTYGDKVNFTVVAQENSTETYQQVVAAFDPEDQLNIVMDKDKRLATAMGVYSTPQAVLLNTNNKLYYRGNYNKSRYCTDPGKFYAQQALDSLLANRPTPTFDNLATTSYGCELDEQKDFIDHLVIF